MLLSLPWLCHFLMSVEVPAPKAVRMALDVEQQEPLIRPHEKRLWARCNVVLWSCIGAALVFLIVMTAVFTGRPINRRGALGPQFEVPAGAFVGCNDDAALCLVAKPVPSPEQDYRAHPRKVSGTRGVVSSDQSRCADIGAAVLEEGGHAVDAAVATALCQGVVNPFASGVGGGHFALIRSANGSAEFINAREVAPGAASYDMYHGKDKFASLDGGLAIAVPLELKGLELTWRRHGRLPWSRLVSPAARIARHGFAAHPYLVYVITGNFTFNRLKSDPLTAEAFLFRDPRDGSFRAPRVGELCCRRPALANTLDAGEPLLSLGVKRGGDNEPIITARNMAQFRKPKMPEWLQPVGKYGVSWLYDSTRLEAMAAEIRKAGGIITAQDFKVAEPRVEVPLRYTLPGPVPYTLLVPPPPSSGAVLALALSLVLGYNTTLEQMGPTLAAHRTVESMKHAFAVRNALGDPGTPSTPFTDVSAVLADIANASFIASLRATINDSAVLPLSQYGGRWNPQSSGLSPEDHGTSHLVVVDSEGNAVSLTTTVNTAFGSNVMSASTGILFNNEMDDFSRPGIQNTYSLQSAEANYIRPYKRPLSSMSPSMVLAPPSTAAAPEAGRSGGGNDSPAEELRLVVGASNGPRIITGIMQTVLRVLYQGVDLLAAVSSSRLHHQWLPDRCLYENFTLNGVSFTPDPAVIGNLSARGDVMVPYTDQLGDVQAILLPYGTNAAAVAVADPRKDGAPAAAKR